MTATCVRRLTRDHPGNRPPRRRLQHMDVPSARLTAVLAGGGLRVDVTFPTTSGEQAQLACNTESM
jgi:hypothetical protein